MEVTINNNPIDIPEGMTARQIINAAGFTEGHHLALEMPDGTLMHLDDNEVVKPSRGDRFMAVPHAKKGDY
jgi:hypothetical protein